MANYFPSKQGFSLEEFLQAYNQKLHLALQHLNINDLENVLIELTQAIERKSTIFTCGNGGSSAIAEHLVCDFVKGASTDTTIEPKVIPLLSTPIVTAIANDNSYDDIFSYQVQKYGEEKDVLLSVSSSGNSNNIIKAIELAKSKNMVTISFVGFDGGRAKEISDHSIYIKSSNYGICEDAHHSLMHILAQYLRLEFIDSEDKVGKIKF